MIDGLKKILARLGITGNGNGGDGAEDEMIRCEEALEHLFEYLDGELEGDTREQVERHFEICRRCYPRLQFEESFMEAIRRVRSGDEAPPELRHRIMAVLGEEGIEPD